MADGGGESVCAHANEGPSCQDSEKVVSGRWLADDEITEAADQSLLWKLSQNT